MDDPFERQADAIAEQVLRMPDPASALVQRCPGGCPPGGCHDDEVQRAATTNGLRPSGTGSPIHVLPGQGEPLPRVVRSFFEPRFGADFGNVRIHTDDRAAQLAAEYSARAFTYQRNIVFARGEYAPSTKSGRRLLAHELTHVLQQRSGVQCQELPGETADEEVEEDLEVAQVVGASPLARILTTPAPKIQRVCDRSPDEVGYQVAVDLAIPATPAPNRSRTTAQISQRARDPNGRTMGFTEFRAHLHHAVTTRTVGGRSWVTNVRAFFQNASIRIFLTRDLPRGSCELADLERHEWRHDADFRNNAAEAEASICDIAGTWPSDSSNGFPITGPQLRGLIADWMDYENFQLAYENWLDACTWDLVDYPRLYTGCPGTNLSAPAAECNDAPDRPAPNHTLPLPEPVP